MTNNHSQQLDEQQEQHTTAQKPIPASDKAVTENGSLKAPQVGEQTESFQNDAEPTVEESRPSESIQLLTQAEQFKTIKSGMTVRVHERITDITAKGEEKKRIQVFEGMVLARKHGTESGATITVRKISEGIGVEKIYPLNLPDITKIEIMKQSKVRQARPYYLRHYKKRLKESRLDQMVMGG